ncbi:hypothetical protein LT875_002454 [Salmonella enterica]|nr:hypothetical protein [Salmonella enterica]
MNIEISHFPDLIAAMTDSDLECFMGCARREEERLMSALHALHRNQAAFRAERDKRRANRRESLQPCNNQ